MVSFSFKEKLVFFLEANEKLVLRTDRDYRVGLPEF